MKIVQKQLNVSTKQRNQLVDITSRINSEIAQSGTKNGDVIIFCPHTTAAITINENADPDVVHDLLLTLSELIPENRPGYRHAEGNSDSHAKSTLVGCSEQVLIRNGSLDLGTWQSIYFAEFDGPRNRKVKMQIRGD